MFLDSLNFDRKAHYILDSRVPVFTIPVSLLNLQSMPLDRNVTAISARIPDKWCYLLWGSVTTTGHHDCTEERDLPTADEAITKTVSQRTQGARS